MTNWKTQPLKDFFDNIVATRRIIASNVHTAEYSDYYYIEFMLLRNFDETVEFLTHATMEETACAIGVLDNIAFSLSKDKGQIIVNIFKNKLVEFPEIIDNCIYDYIEELEIAQNIIDGKDDE